MILLENESLRIAVSQKGAELKSLINKKTDIEHMWNSDPSYWAKSSPVLFPIVGGLKDNSYCFEGKWYSLPRHGFARDLVFELVSKSNNEAVLKLSSNAKTLEVYPFEFDFEIKYLLNTNKLSVAYSVMNKGESEMYFSLGAHPAFTVPFLENESYNDYFLEFEKDEHLNHWPLTMEGLISNSVRKINLGNRQLPLSKELFYKDALVFKDLKSKSMALKSKSSRNYLKFNFEGFPFFGIWAAKDASFVCLEPWCGIADQENHNQELINKEGINVMKPGATFKRIWEVELF